MLPAGDQTLPAARRIRKSIGSLVRRSDEKENATIDIVENLGVNRKKSRSKSIGPGGLDALKQGTSKRRASLAVPARLPPRSILKPASSLIPEIPPSIKQNKKNTAITSSGSISSSNNVFSIGADPLSNVPEVPQGSKVALRTEEQQQKAARDREERERRAARRKSLANRRVSFAAEATLHTFHEIEYMQDSTASTDHTHQKSSAAASSKNTGRLAEEATDKAQSRTRRSSTGLQPMSSRNNNDDDTMASTVYGSSDSELVEDVEEESSNSDSDADDGTMMSVEVEEMTSASVGSIMESPGLDPDQQDESDTLEKVLRLAARQAGTQRLGDDEEEEEEIIPSFGWAKKPAPKAKPAVSTSTPALDTPTPGDGTQTMDVDMDMDMTTAMGGILRPGQSAAARQNNPQPTEMMDMTMDVTKAVGGILSRQMNEPLVAITHDYSQDEATMEFTTALGAIQSRASSAPGEVDENEDMSMELTTVMGSVLPSALSAAASQRQQTLARVQNEDNTTSAMSMDLDMDMEMTTAMGGILNRRISLPDDDEDAQNDGQTMTMGMDITAAVGRILGTGVSTSLEPEEDETFGMEMTTVLGGILAKSQPAVAPVQDVTDQPLIDLSIAAEAPSELPEISSPPKAIEREVIEEEVRENAWRMAQKEAEGGEATLNLREMIQSLSPKKRPFSNRKSLHVGSARGLLGKRPAELDSEEEDNEARDGVKRLRGLPASPVKNVRLQQPPSKQETAAGRVSKTTATSGLESPDKQSTATTATTPKRDIAKFSNFLSTSDVTRTGQFDFEELPQLPPKDEGGDRIHLHDFLNMTSIRFMELNTTKRRHTIAPTKMDGSVMDFKADMSLERCVVAGACTVPMLELYQHSCRELKKYISEGRRIVREIETETFEENPPLFREYMSATPEFKALMDNQFKNVKTHARLLSKAMWYEWRMKLQYGIKEGLLRIREGMDDDQALVEKQEGLVASVLPAAVEKQETLTKEKDNIEAFVKEISACDPQELQTARDDLANTTDRIAAKRKEIENLKRELEETEADIASSIEYKKECQEAIVEAERIREECRGWSTVEINALKARVERLEKKHGWAVSAITAAWDKCRAVCDDLRIANTMFPTRVVAPASGTTGIGPADPAPSISVHWSLLISQLDTRVEIAIRLEARLSPDGVDVAVVPDAHIIYGEAFNTAKMLEFWRAKAGDKVCVRAERDKTDKTGWCDVLVDLQARLLARGRKARSA
ncbi:Kinetochore protein spc7 [Ceratocystis platani]|uniref:Kinetochore protein spc7 n=1 Tax=Ceratocystis fimbriata f. sp. platani TaxID=88771 RepID=A0A0F8BQ91_CERFI|nr:Kinetochore protein spc7 [Ceratocystis platani]